MIATLTSKGQITLPKSIRDQLRLVSGDRLDFRVDKGGELRARPIHGSVLRLAGIAKGRIRRRRTIEEMDDAIALAAAESMK